MPATCHLARGWRTTINRARERGVGLAEWRLPYHRELVKEVRRGRNIGILGQEIDGTFAGADELLQGRPAFIRNGHRRWLVRVLIHARRSVSCCPYSGVDAVRVDHENRDDLVRVVVHPRLDLGQVGCKCPCIKQHATGRKLVEMMCAVPGASLPDLRRVAKVQLVVVHVTLYL